MIILVGGLWLMLVKEKIGDKTKWRDGRVVRFGSFLCSPTYNELSFNNKNFY